MPCLSQSFDPAVGPVVNVGIAPAGTIKAGAEESTPIITYTALLDTGADITCISAKVASERGLRPSGKRRMGGSTGTGDVNTYLIDIGFPFGKLPTAGAPPSAIQAFILQNVQVMEYVGAHPKFNVLIGRDIICQGLFSMSGWDKRFILCLG